MVSLRKTSIDRGEHDEIYAIFLKCKNSFFQYLRLGSSCATGLQLVIKLIEDVSSLKIRYGDILHKHKKNS